MQRCTPFFILFLVFIAMAPVSASAQDAGGSQPKADQSKPDDKKGGDGSNVLILKSPEMPAQPQFTPELRPIDLEKRRPVDNTTKIHLIQLMDAEFGHVRKYLPLGDKAVVIDPQGRVTPNDVALFQAVQTHGAAAKVGDKVQITNVIFHDKSVYFEVNGGPKKKTKWYQHISVGVGGAGGGVTPINGQESTATGAAFTLQFSKPVPDMNLDEFKKLVSPVIDFSTKSAVEVYSESLPPKIRNAVMNHEVLVGMNHEMVRMAKERPDHKVRERDEKGKEYEDWIYGKPPQETVFVRFVGDEVTMVTIAKVTGPPVVKTQKEVDVKDGIPSLTALQAGASPEEAAQQSSQSQDQEQPVRKAPTLRRDGEAADPVLQPPTNNGPTQGQLPHPNEPEWGTGNKPQQDPPKPPQ